MKTKRKKITLRRVLSLVLCLGILGISSLTVINAVVKLCAGDQILTEAEAATLEGVDCILILGCGVRDDGTPSDMLRDRLNRGIALYDLGAAAKVLMSGDHGRVEYDEVAVMKQFAVDADIPSEKVFMDHAGFSTYESIYRARDIFQADKIVIVTQEYHLYRAIYIANRLGLDAYGVAADYHTYAGQFVRDFREVLARVKDFGTCILKPKPTFLGDIIPVSGNGNLTNDGTKDFT